MKLGLSIAAAMVAVGAFAGRQGPWTKEKAWAWHDAQPWYRGCNYMPASAANRVDQWQSYGSEARFAEVEREFALAKEVGFNAMRLLILEQGFAVWLQEPDAFRANFERYLALMEKYGLKAFVVLGNDCSRPKRVWTMPKLGEQEYDVGYHGGRRQTQHGGFSEPGYLMMDDPEYRAKFFGMCRELVTKYAHDGRVVMWELWNEPGAGNRGMMSAPLIKDLFALCWEIDPDQPLTANLWSSGTWPLANGEEPPEIQRLALDLSDVISYHGYHGVATQAKLADELAKRWGRPLYNTEWLLRIEGCDFPDNYAFMARRKIGALNWGFVNGKYQTHEPYEPCWRSKFEYGGRGDPTKWMHDLFRISHHPYDPYEIAVARNVNAWADLDRRGESLRAKIAKGHRIVREDMWYGYCRTAFEFNGHEAWIVEPACPPAEGRPWTWTMQWAEAFVDRTGVLDLLKRGYHHVTIDLFETRMDEKGLADAAAYQEFLVKELGFAPQANLVGMSWGGFFSTRYAATHPQNVRKIYLDAPLMNFDGFGDDAKKTPTAGAAWIGPWATDRPKEGGWSSDPRMPVNMAEPIAKAGIPILLLYGGQDQSVIPALNCERFVTAFKAAGGDVTVMKRGLFGHHPHGLDPNKTQPVVDFFSSAVTARSEPACVQEADTYNSWPMVQALGKRLVCAYSRGSAHTIDEGARGVFVRHSDDAGRTWSEPTKVIDDPKEGEVSIGKGLGEKGEMLLWVRCWDKWAGPNLHHDLYRSADGVRFERIAELRLDPNPMQITDIVRVPGVGLMSLWFAGLYKDDGTCAWGTLVSTDNGRTWRQTTVERGLHLKDWPTEQSFVSLGDGRLLAVARSEKNTGPLFQLVSSDSGRTWRKLRTNVADVAESTPSLVLDEATGDLSLYYYHRGAKKLKRRVANVEKAFAEPTAWSDPEVLFTGEEERPYDAGNVNLTVLDGTHYAAFYTGTSKKTAVMVLPVGQSEAKVK